jgi:hypothetical protein
MITEQILKRRRTIREGRRNILKGSLVALLMALITKSATAATSAGGDSGTAAMGKHAPGSVQAHGQPSDAQGLLDAFAVSQVLLRERLARETHNYDEAEACFYPDADVEVSWFKGTATEFVDAARTSGTAGNKSQTVNFDSLGPACVSVHKDRAIADSACALHTFLPLDGVETSLTSYCRLLCRVQKSGGEWRIAALRAIYIRDQLVPCHPAEIPKIDLEKLKQYRPSYRHLSYVLQAGGRPMHNDLPGVDQPEVVAALRAGDRQWLYGSEMPAPR